MKRTIAATAAILALTAPVTVLAQVGAPAGHAQPAHGGGADHEERVGDVKVIFKFVSMKEHLQAAKMEMPKGMKETHHLKLDFIDAKTGKPLTEGEVRVKVQGPDKSAQVKDLVGMNNRFCADFDFSKKGKYGVMAKYQLKGDQVRSAKFWYNVK